MDLVNRRQVLINLISRVGRGQQNIYRWVDELISIILFSFAKLKSCKRPKHVIKLLF